MNFNPTIDLGSLLNAFVVLVGAAAFVRFLGWRVDRLEKKVDLMTDTLTKVAIQDTRIDRLESDVRELRHGDGFVLPIGRGPG